MRFFIKDVFVINNDSIRKYPMSFFTFIFIGFKKSKRVQK
jgi:hypothetical protein